MNPRIRAWFCALIFCLGACLVTAQSTTGSGAGPLPGTSLPGVKTTQGGDTPVAPNEFSSPRATIRTFTEAVQSENFRLARQAIDLSSIPFALREQEGTRLARQLAAVLDRTRIIDLNQVPANVDGEPYLFSRYVDATGRVVGEVVIAKQADGAWRFTNETTLAIPAIFGLKKDDPSRSGMFQSEEALLDPGGYARSLFDPQWYRTVLGLEFWQWILAGCLVLFSVALVPVIRRLVRWVVRLRVPFIRENVTEGSEKGLKASLVALVLTQIWLASLPYLALPLAANAIVVFVLRVLAGVGLAWLLFALFDAVIDVSSRVGEGLGKRAEHILVPVVRKFGKFVILVGTTFFIASTFDLNLAGVVAGLGIGGLVVALAAKDSVENLFGSFTILFDMPFGVGDWVKVSGVDGVVEEINLRSTRIRTFEDSVITLPNSNLIKASVENLGQRRSRRVRVVLGLEYDTSPEKIDEFCVALREMLLAHPRTRKDTIRAAFHDYSESSLGILLYCYLETTNYDEELQMRHEMMLEVKRIAERVGVSFAFPTRTLMVRREERGTADFDL